MVLRSCPYWGQARSAVSGVPVCAKDAHAPLMASLSDLRCHASGEEGRLRRVQVPEDERDVQRMAGTELAAQGRAAPREQVGEVLPRGFRVRSCVACRQQPVAGLPVQRICNGRLQEFLACRFPPQHLPERPRVTGGVGGRNPGAGQDGCGTLRVVRVGGRRRTHLHRKRALVEVGSDQEVNAAVHPVPDAVQWRRRQ